MCVKSLWGKSRVIYTEKISSGPSVFYLDTGSPCSRRSQMKVSYFSHLEKTPCFVSQDNSVVSGQ